MRLPSVSMTCSSPSTRCYLPSAGLSLVIERWVVSSSARSGHFGSIQFSDATASGSVEVFERSLASIDSLNNLQAPDFTLGYVKLATLKRGGRPSRWVSTPSVTLKATRSIEAPYRVHVFRSRMPRLFPNLAHGR